MCAQLHKIYVVEDDPHTRAHLVQVANSHESLQVIGSAENLADARQDWALLLQAEAVLVDLGLPDGDGADLITALRDAAPNVCALVITVFGDERHVIRAIEAGARGYLLKDSDVDALGELIIRTLAGDVPINPSIARHLLKRLQPAATTIEASATPQPSPITERETEVLRLVARGFTNAEVADLISVSLNTVTSHTKNIYRKLSVNSRSEAVFEATQMGLIALDRNDTD